jgi:large subunit ribosomal protein L9
MKVILQQNVQKLGKAGDIVDTSDGYFRNFLQPRKLAVVATEGTLKKREEDLASLRKKAEAAHQEAVNAAEKISAIGKITNKEIAIELEKHLGYAVDKRLIKTNDEISALGTYKVVVKLQPEVHSELTLEVHQEGWVQAELRPLAAVSAGADQAPAEEVEVED